MSITRILRYKLYLIENKIFETAAASFRCRSNFFFFLEHNPTNYIIIIKKKVQFFSVTFCFPTFFIFSDRVFFDSFLFLPFKLQNGGYN